MSDTDNVLADPDATPGNLGKKKRFPLIEVFGPTIQGEGPLAGSKTMFLRFGGCDFRCQKCDSLHAVIPQAIKKHATYLTAEAILAELTPIMERSGTKWVTFSGGNPCMHDLTELQQMLHFAGYNVAVETQGTLAPDWLRNSDVVVVSPKSPGMGEKCDFEQLEAFAKVVRGPVLALKVVVFAQIDIDFALSVAGVLEGYVSEGLRFMSLGNPYPPILSPDNDLIDGPNTPSDLPWALLEEYRVLIEDFVNDPRISDWKFLPQLHVLTWANESEH